MGLLAARTITARKLAAAGAEYTQMAPGLFLLGALGFLAILALMSLGGLLLIRRRSVLELIQEKT